MHFEYCPTCGSHLQPKPAGDEGPVPFCPVCQRYWFDFFYSCIIILLCNEQDEVVLCKQPHLSQEYERITSGFIMPGETAEETAHREVREELGLPAGLRHHPAGGSCHQAVPQRHSGADHRASGG